MHENRDFRALQCLTLASSTSSAVFLTFPILGNMNFRVWSCYSFDMAVRYPDSSASLS